VGEDKLPVTFAIAPDGTADLPYIQRIHVAGLEPQEIAEAVRVRLIERQVPDPFLQAGDSIYVEQGLL
jgi:polysaccharide export outer membrane protein